MREKTSSYRNSRQTSHRRKMSPGQQIAECVLDEFGSHSAFLRIRETIISRCRAADVQPPSLRSITARVAHRRALAAERLAPIGSLIVDHCALDLPVRLIGSGVDETTMLPMVTFAIVDPGGAIAAASLIVGPPEISSTASVILAAAAAMRGEQVLGLRVRCRGAGDWPTLLAALNESPAPTAPTTALKGSTGSAVRRLIGRRLSDINLRPRPAGHQLIPDGLHPCREDLAVVERTFRNALTRYNANRPAIDDLALVHGMACKNLLASLSKLSDQNDRLLTK